MWNFRDALAARYTPSDLLARSFNQGLPARRAGQQLFLTPFAKATSTFGTPVMVANDSGQASGVRPGWPAFLPDDQSVVLPFCSDPRGVNLVTNITTKKLWVAAIDVGAKPGTDASHPAFYLPAQELLAGNSRAFWVLDPCLADGASCTAGDQCCDGYCEQGDGGGLVYGNKPPNATCSQQGDKCTSSANCCQSNDSCIDGFCEQSTAQ